MKFKDLFNFRMSEHGKALKGGKTDEELEVSLATDTLEDGTVIEYEALEIDAEVFVIVEGEEPALAPDATHTLSDGQMIVTVDGKITEIKPKEEAEEEETEEVELSEEQKKAIALAMNFDVAALENLVNLKEDGWYTIEFGVSNGKVNWADLYSNTYKMLMAEQVDPIKVELEAEKKETEKLKAQIVILQEQNDQRNPLEKVVKLEDEKPLTPYEIQIGVDR